MKTTIFLNNKSFRPFLARKFFQEILGLEGSKISWVKKYVSYEEIFFKISSPKISSGNFNSDSPRRGNFQGFAWTAKISTGRDGGKIDG